MKRIYPLLAALLLVLTINAQSPDKFNYQAVIRNSDGSIKANQSVNIQIGILQGSITGTSMYIETFAVTTNSIGLVNLVIGNGTVVSGSLSGIDWSAGLFFLKIWVDSIEMGTSQLLSVPYAKYAEKAGNGFSGNYSDLSGKPSIFDGSWNSLSDKPSFNDTLNKYSVLINGNQNIAGNKNFTSSINVPTPINANDAVNKSFVTLHVSTAGDSLFLGNNQYVIIPGISLANPFRYPVNDMDGNGYDTIRIGTQVWLGENLKTTKYNDGTLIPLVTADSSWINLSTPAYCWCNNDSITYKNPYGAFYNWYTINTGKICPIGWHIPSNSDWAFLFSYLGSNAGGKMKEAGTQHWKSPNAGANNSSKFNALPAGGRVNGGSFVYIGYDVGYWSSDNDPGNTAVTRNWDYNNTFVGYFNGYKFYGFPVRCLKN